MFAYLTSLCLATIMVVLCSPDGEESSSASDSAAEDHVEVPLGSRLGEDRVRSARIRSVLQAIPVASLSLVACIFLGLALPWNSWPLMAT